MTEIKTAVSKAGGGPRAGARAVLAGLMVCGLAAGVASAADRQIQVEWSNPELKNFATSPARGLAANVLPADASRIAKLKLPVLGFERPPQQLTRSLSVGANPKPDRSLVMDDENPVWYQIVERYGDITVTIDADLRLQEELPPSAKIYGQLPKPDETTPVNVVDGATEPGMEGAMASYTVFKYPNVPYRVVIECNAKAIDYCRNVGSVNQDQQFLKLIAAGTGK